VSLVQHMLDSWMRECTQGNGRGNVLARMAGKWLCSKKTRSNPKSEHCSEISTDAFGGMWSYWTSGKSQGRLLPLIFILFSSNVFALESTRQKLQYKESLDASPEELQAARGLEQMYVKQMIDEMRKSIPDNEWMPSSQGEKIFRQMLDDEYSRMITESGTIGIADLIVADFKRRR
jgi:hypothetical protein